MDKPFNLRSAILAKVRGKVKRNLPPIANKTANRKSTIIIKNLKPFDNFFDDILLINLKSK